MVVYHERDHSKLDLVMKLEARYPVDKGLDVGRHGLHANSERPLELFLRVWRGNRSHERVREGRNIPQETRRRWTFYEAHGELCTMRHHIELTRLLTSGYGVIDGGHHHSVGHCQGAGGTAPDTYNFVQCFDGIPGLVVLRHAKRTCS